MKTIKEFKKLGKIKAQCINVWGDDYLVEVEIRSKDMKVYTPVLTIPPKHLPLPTKKELIRDGDGRIIGWSTYGYILNWGTREYLKVAEFIIDLNSIKGVTTSD